MTMNVSLVAITCLTALPIIPTGALRASLLRDLHFTSNTSQCFGHPGTDNNNFNPPQRSQDSVQLQSPIPTFDSWDSIVKNPEFAPRGYFEKWFGNVGSTRADEKKFMILASKEVQGLGQTSFNTLGVGSALSESDDTANDIKGPFKLINIEGMAGKDDFLRTADIRKQKVKLMIDKEGENELNSLSGPFHIMSVHGVMRTGKSTILTMIARALNREMSVKVPLSKDMVFTDYNGSNLSSNDLFSESASAVHLHQHNGSTKYFIDALLLNLELKALNDSEPHKNSFKLLKLRKTMVIHGEKTTDTIVIPAGYEFLPPVMDRTTAQRVLKVNTSDLFDIRDSLNMKDHAITDSLNMIRNAITSFLAQNYSRDFSITAGGFKETATLIRSIIVTVFKGELSYFEFAPAFRFVTAPGEQLTQTVGQTFCHFPKREYDPISGRFINRGTYILIDSEGAQNPIRHENFEMQMFSVAYGLSSVVMIRPQADLARRDTIDYIQTSLANASEIIKKTNSQFEFQLDSYRRISNGHMGKLLVDQSEKMRQDRRVYVLIKDYEDKVYTGSETDVDRKTGDQSDETRQTYVDILRRFSHGSDADFRFTADELFLFAPPRVNVSNSESAKNALNGDVLAMGQDTLNVRFVETLLTRLIRKLQSEAKPLEISTGTGQNQVWQITQGKELVSFAKALVESSNNDNAFPEIYKGIDSIQRGQIDGFIKKVGAEEGAALDTLINYLLMRKTSDLKKLPTYNQGTKDNAAAAQDLFEQMYKVLTCKKTVSNMQRSSASLPSQQIANSTSQASTQNYIRSEDSLMGNLKSCKAEDFTPIFPMPPSILDAFIDIFLQKIAEEYKNHVSSLNPVMYNEVLMKIEKGEHPALKEYIKILKDKNFQLIMEAVRVRHIEIKHNIEDRVSGKEPYNKGNQDDKLSSFDVELQWNHVQKKQPEDIDVNYYNGKDSSAESELISGMRGISLSGSTSINATISEMQKTFATPLLISKNLRIEDIGVGRCKDIIQTNFEHFNSEILAKFGTASSIHGLEKMIHDSLGDLFKIVSQVEATNKNKLELLRAHSYAMYVKHELETNARLSEETKKQMAVEFANAELKNKKKMNEEKKKRDLLIEQQKKDQEAWRKEMEENNKKQEDYRKKTDEHWEKRISSMTESHKEQLKFLKEEQGKILKQYKAEAEIMWQKEQEKSEREGRERQENYDRKIRQLEEQKKREEENLRRQFEQHKSSAGGDEKMLQILVTSFNTQQAQLLSQLEQQREDAKLQREDANQRADREREVNQKQIEMIRGMSQQQIEQMRQDHAAHMKQSSDCHDKSMQMMSNQQEMVVSFAKGMFQQMKKSHENSIALMQHSEEQKQHLMKGQMMLMGQLYKDTRNNAIQNEERGRLALQDANDRREQERENWQVALRDQRDDLRETYGQQIETMRGDHGSQMRMLRDDYGGRINSMREDHTGQMRMLREDHTGQINMLREGHDQMMRCQENGFEKHVQLLGEQLGREFERNQELQERYDDLQDDFIDTQQDHFDEMIGMQREYQDQILNQKERENEYFRNEAGKSVFRKFGDFVGITDIKQTFG